MANHDKDKRTPPPSPAPRQRERLEERNEANTETERRDERDPRNMTPEGRDPRQPTSHVSDMATSENVLTEEQKAAQAAMQKGDLGGTTGTATADEQRLQAAQIESQVAAAENPLGPVSTVMPPAGIAGEVGLGAPPVPPNQPGVPQPVTQPGQRPTAEQREEQKQQTRQRRKLEEDTTEVKLRAPVTLTDDQGRQHHYAAGKQKIPTAHAEHWYVQQFISDDEQDT